MAGEIGMGDEIRVIGKNAREHGSTLPLLELGEKNQRQGILEYGEKLLSNSTWINDFVCAALRIADVVISSGAWKNPLEFLFKGKDFGYAIEELFINVGRPRGYDPFGKGEEVWKRAMPDVRMMLHTVNVKTTAQVTVYDDGIRTAFTNEYEWRAFLQKIVESVQNTLSLTLYTATKYLMALYAIEAGIVAINVADYKSNPKEATKQLQIISDKMEFYKPDYNPTGVYNFTRKEDQYLIVTPEFNAEQDVEVLAYMFNIGKGELPQKKIMIDDFSTHDYSFLSQIFEGGVPHEFTESEIAQLEKLPVMLISKDTFFIYKLFDRWASEFNSLKLYWNYFHHWQGTFSYSPFANAVALYTGVPEEPKEIVNPYGAKEIREGRNNLFYVRNAFTKGGISSKKIIKGIVEGEALIKDEDYPGWYVVANKKGMTATITYSYEGLESVVVNLITI